MRCRRRACRRPQQVAGAGARGREALGSDGSAPGAVGGQAHRQTHSTAAACTSHPIPAPPAQQSAPMVVHASWRCLSGSRTCLGGLARTVHEQAVSTDTLEAPPPDIPRLGMSGGGAFFLRPTLCTYSNSANAAIFTFSSPVPPRPLPTWGSNPFSRDCLS